ncbi:hypothetical protein AKJ58_01595 [candidate division MSBL1 archaeon SCGC-AAA385D11]|uniref:ArnR1-like winged helix-turn-helix domain-containing protein n=1 Tax=candidate division MSBL1 archaeon SCGC-AAA385D11 TaxID=1698286 RepID=A0A133VN49_9EURY|nr:hypothetical protein AKJ58_01595 [candidate division MSBL1 archaeon SCGC-AAA385D11]
MDWDKYGFVSASKYRKKVVLALQKKPKTPKEIEEEVGYHLSHVSNTLGELSDEGIVRCLTEKRSKGRVYGLTKLGEEIAQQLVK